MPPKGLGAKRQKVLQSLLGYTSDRALANILRYLKHAGELDPSFQQSLSHLTAGLRQDVAALLVSVQMERRNGEVKPWQCLDPNRLLAHVVESCLELAATVGRAANQSPPTAPKPWGSAVCFDECTPGDKLKSHSSRKALVLGGLMIAGLVMMIGGQPLHLHAKLVDVRVTTKAFAWHGTGGELRPCALVSDVLTCFGRTQTLQGDWDAVWR